MKYLGIDFGLRRIGLATSEGNIAFPYKIVEGKNFSEIVEKIKKEAEGFDKVVVGMPQGKMGQNVLGFIKALRKSGLDVVEADETLSSQKAVSQMIELNVPKEKRRMNDAYSAAVILQGYLDNL
ncbi:pre-16S rRNA-processing nuclease YqgF [Candidatus Daviesbacteria bacterium]|nr:pre-16S rRNA-processing nuclease YqgF [Candidatus Daviesbacteria bacterium]